MQSIGEIRDTEAKSKGVGNPSLNGSYLVRELVFKILPYLFNKRRKYENDSFMCHFIIFRGIFPLFSIFMIYPAIKYTHNIL